MVLLGDTHENKTRWMIVYDYTVPIQSASLLNYSIYGS